MDENEQFVRSVWERVNFRFSEPFEGYAQGVYVVEGPEWKFNDKLASCAYIAAADFTRQRLEEVRRLVASKSALVFVIGDMRSSSLGIDLGTALELVEDKIRQLTQGMKEGSWK